MVDVQRGCEWQESVPDIVVVVVFMQDGVKFESLRLLFILKIVARFRSAESNNIWLSRV